VVGEFFAIHSSGVGGELVGWVVVSMKVIFSGGYVGGNVSSNDTDVCPFGSNSCKNMLGEVQVSGRRGENKWRT
jgi:hypothetical protein